MTIYGLVDPRTGEVRYIGYTKYTPERRLVGHVKVARRGTNLPVSHWIRKLEAVGLRPTASVLEANVDDYAEAERRWIAYGRSLGWSLLNATDGGDGVPDGGWSGSRRDRSLSEAELQQRRAALENAHTAWRDRGWGGPMSEESRERMRVAQAARRAREAMYKASRA